MDDRSFDSLTRQVAADGTRRGPLAMLAAPGMEAIANQLSAEAKKRKGKKNKKQNAQQCPPAPDRCGPQVATCTTIMTVACSGRASCLASSTACCSLLATCDSAGFFVCLGHA